MSTTETVILILTSVFALVFAWLAPRLRKVWDEHDQTKEVQQQDRAVPTGRKKRSSVRGGSYYPVGATPPRRWNIIGRYLFGRAATMSFSSNGFRLSLPGYDFTYRYTDIIRVETTLSGYLRFSMDDTARLYLRTSQADAIIRFLADRKVATPGKWKANYAAMAPSLVTILPLYSLLIYLLLSDGSWVRAIIWALLPFVNIFINAHKDA